MSELSPETAERLPEFLPQLQALQAALLESARQLSVEASRFAHQWQGAWPDSTVASDLDQSLDELRANLDTLVYALGQADMLPPTQIAGLLGALLGTETEPGPLVRLQQLTQSGATTPSLKEQQLLSEVDVLRIQLNALRAQWQDYLSLATPLQRATGPQHRLPAVRQAVAPAPVLEPGEAATGPLVQLEEKPRLPPLPLRPTSAPEEADDLLPPPIPPLPPNPYLTRPRRRPLTEPFGPGPPPPPIDPDDLPVLGASALPEPPTGESLRHGLGGTLATFLTLFAVLALIIGVSYAVVTHLPQTAKPTPTFPAPTDLYPVPPTPSVPVAPTLSAPTATPQALPTDTTVPQPTTTAAPAPGSAQLAINPAVLLVPCPGAGAGTLQLVNTGSQPLNWQAAASSLSGGSPGITLDTTQGHLAVGGVALVNVTALVQRAQGTISVSYTGATSPATVAYTVSC